MDLTPAFDDFVRIYLAVFFTFVAVFYTTRIWHLKRRDGREFVHPGPRLSGTWWNHMVFRVFRVLIWAVCVIRVFVPGIDGALGPIAAMQRFDLVLTGVGLLTAGFGLALVSHFTLGHGWRSGFDREDAAQLRVAGVYRHSRNPAFLGVMIAQVGFWLALPSWFSTLCLGVGMIAVYRQTMSEERFLETAFGAQYADYKQRVRRWI